MKYIFFFIIILTLSKGKIENSEEITIEVNPLRYSRCTVGDKEGKFGIDSKTQDTNDFFNTADIQENTHFNFNITSEKGNIYPLDCRLCGKMKEKA